MSTHWGANIGQILCGFLFCISAISDIQLQYFAFLYLWHSRITQILYQHQWTKPQNISESRTHMCLSFITIYYLLIITTFIIYYLLLSFITTVHNFLIIHPTVFWIITFCLEMYVFFMFYIFHCWLEGKNLAAFHQQQQDYGLASSSAPLSASS